MKLAVLVNGRIARENTLAALRAAAPNAAFLVTRSPDEVGPALRCVADAEMVAVCGGDGTLLGAATAFVDQFAQDGPIFAPLGGGTMNTVAANLGVPRQAPARNLARIARGCRTRAQPLLRCNDRHGFLFASAMGARFLEIYYRGRPGLPRAIGLALRTAGSCVVSGHLARTLFDPVPLEVTVDGCRAGLPSARLIAAGVIEDVGLGMRLLPRARAESGRFQFVACGLDTPRLAMQVYRVLAGRAIEGEDAAHIDRLAHEIELKFARPESFTLDGDLFTSDRVRLSTGPIIRIPRFEDAS